jgi:F-type H+-transporting ATPase subunit b
MRSPNSCYSGLPTGFLTFLFGIVITSLWFPPAAAASEGTAGWGVWETVGRFFNLGVVIAVLVYALRKPLSQFFEERRLNIRRSLEEAQQAKMAAEARLAEMQTRMAGLDLELQQIKEKALREAEEERTRASLLADQESERIIAAARREADALVKAATIELRQEAAKLAVQLAENKIHAEMGSEIDDRMVESFVRQLGKVR